ncbi:sushi domain protein [Ancylostoma ceylanicum]|uniref:Sushi domain protein n=1 Tax=Ancylostoma ceylanicum TaxID=53326 RepID=A0A0D6LH83_9BILA|nr:sushi domain protein [Ancylostoma ceylanicum]
MRVEDRFCPPQRNSSHLSVYLTRRNLFIGTVAQFSCPVGYKPHGHTTATCEDDGTWSHSPPKCHGKCGFDGLLSEEDGYEVYPSDIVTAIQCPPLAVDSRSMLVTVSSYKFGGIAQFQCAKGFVFFFSFLRSYCFYVNFGKGFRFTLIGAEHIHCQSDSTWSDKVPICTVVKCDKLEPPQNAVLLSPPRTHYHRGDVLLFGCLPNHILTGGDFVVCQPNGQWTKVITKLLGSGLVKSHCVCLIGGIEHVPLFVYIYVFDILKGMLLRKTCLSIPYFNNRCGVNKYEVIDPGLKSLRQIHSEQDRDFFLGSKLHSCLTSWKDSYHLLTELDAPQGQVYDSVRRAAIRLERAREAEMLVQKRNERSQAKIPFAKYFKQGSDKGSKQEHGIDATSSGNREKRCFQCGETGHYARKCPCKQGRRGKEQEQHQKTDGGVRKTNSGKLKGSFSAQVRGWCCSIREPGRRLILTKAYGKPCVCKVDVFGIKAQAIVDTGSIVSIVPVGLLKQAMDKAIDLDSMVTMMGDGNKHKVVDASGNSMDFLMLIATDLRVEGAGAARVQMHVQQSMDTTILLGTNALEPLNIRVQMDEMKAQPATLETTATVAKRVVVQPGRTAMIQVSGALADGDCVFWSENRRIMSGVCRVSKGVATVSAVNHEEQPWVIRKGETLGTWSTDTWIDPRTKEVTGDMLELTRRNHEQTRDRFEELINILDTNRRAGPMPQDLKQLVHEYKDVFAISDLELSHTNLVDHDIDVGGHSPIRQRTRPVPLPTTDPGSVDFTCPGSITRHGQQLYCRIAEPWKTFAPYAPLGDLVFPTVYEFARATSILQQSHISNDQKIAHILNSNYVILSSTALGFVLSAYRAKCYHFMQYMDGLLDPTTANTVHPPRSEDDPFDMSELYQQAISWAFAHPWNDNLWRQIRLKPTLVLLPQVFEEHVENFTAKRQIVKSYGKPKSIQDDWFDQEFSAVILFNPTEYSSLINWKTAWSRILMTVAEGADLFVLPGPKDDKDWGKSVDMLRDLCEETLALKPSLLPRLRCLLPTQSEMRAAEHPCEIPLKMMAGTSKSYSPHSVKVFFDMTQAFFGQYFSLKPFRCPRQEETTSQQRPRLPLSGGPSREALSYRQWKAQSRSLHREREPTGRHRSRSLQRRTERPRFEPYRRTQRSFSQRHGYHDHTGSSYRSSSYNQSHSYAHPSGRR